MKSTSTVQKAESCEFEISYAKRTSWEMKSFHFHDCFEVFLALSDGVKCFVNDKVYDVKRGDLFIFNPLVLHRTVMSEEVTYERFVIIFKSEFITEVMPSAIDLLDIFYESGSNQNLLAHLDEEQLKELVSLIKKADYWCTAELYRKDLHKRVALIEILLYINSIFHSSKSVREVSPEENFRKIKPVLEYIGSNLCEDLPLDKLTAMFYMSKSHLSSLFKRYTGFTVNEFIINRRISKARDLLRKNYSVYQVCEMTGFNNYSHFIRTFTHLVGISPKQYSKQGR